MNVHESKEPDPKKRRILTKGTPPKKAKRPELQKAPTGISGLDDLTQGGLPKSRPTLIAGSAGCGKTLFGIEFLVRGALQYGEPGVFMCFEETEEELKTNVASLGFNLQELINEKKLAIDFVKVERAEIEETGEYDLEGLFVRLNFAIDRIGAKRVVLDTLEALFAGLKDTSALRAELRRLFGWLKQKGVTAVITAERGEGALTRHGLEEYVSDCVILLDHRVVDQLSTRRLRVVKYRGSVHGTNEYPFLIDDKGITVMPATSLLLEHQVSEERLSTGVPNLDEMLGGKGYFRGSSILVSGSAGTGKTSLAASFALDTCTRGEKCLYFCFEESPAQLFRNMKSIGMDLLKFHKKGLLKIVATRPSFYGLEMHLVSIHKEIELFKPLAVILDPITGLTANGTENEVRMMLTRLIDSLKSTGVTAFLTGLTARGQQNFSDTEIGISSLIDTWLLLQEVESVGERNRALYILKSRGMPHSNQVREFLISSKGINLVDVYISASGILTGSERKLQQAQDLLRGKLSSGQRRIPTVSVRPRTELAI